MMKTISLKIVIGTILLLLLTPASAQPSAIAILQTAVGSSLDQVFNKLQSVTILWLGSFILLQFTWTNFHLLLSGADLERVWAKFVGSLFWFGICFYIFDNGPPFIKTTATYIMNIATGTTGAVFDPMAPVDVGINVAATLLATLDGTNSVLGALNPFPSIMMGLVSLVILAVSALVAFKVFMIFIETKMVIALSPFSFALLGLNAFKDQGLAPLKYLVSMALRMFLYGAVIAAMTVFSDTVVAAFKALPAASDPSVWPPIWAAAIGYGLLGALTLRVDSIAVMLASGSSQMSTGDSAAVGAIANAAAGMAMGAATGGSSAAAAAAKVPETMGNFMKNMGGRSGASITNASANGTGSATMETRRTAPAMSMAGGGQATGSAPRRPSAPPSSNTVPPVQTASNASGGVAAAGGSQVAANAAAMAAPAGGSNEAGSAAGVSVGGTPEQGAAAAMTIGAAGGSPAAIKAGAQAAGAGKTPVSMAGGGQATESAPRRPSAPPSSKTVSPVQTASNASEGVAAAGGSQVAANAAAMAALAGGSNEAVSAAVVSAGGTAEQGAAAATAMAIGAAGGSPAAIKAGAQAAGAGKIPADVAQAVMNSVEPSSVVGPTREVATAAASASQTKPAQVGSASDASIGGAPVTGSRATLDDVMKLIAQQNKPRPLDRTKGLRDLILNEAPPVQIQMNTHQGD